jgi:two-component system LytT family sensor kinase
MIISENHPYIALLYSSRNLQFWVLQIVGWFGLSLISFLSLTLWYDQQSPAYIGHTLLQSGLGVVVSWPLRSLFHFFWNDKLIFRLSAVLAGIIGCSLVWTILRITTFMSMTGEQGVWSDFGGWLFGSILIFLCWVAFYHGIKYYQLLQSEHESLLEIASDKQREQLKRSQAETIAREAQLKMLRYQLNPHFLFNTLNAISALVQIKQATKANSMIVQLSQFLRYSLDNDPVQMVSLQQELAALRLYLNIEQTRFGDRLVLAFEIQPECNDVHVPSLILQPLAENAIKHGIAPNEAGGKLTVSARLDSSDLTIEITDTGPGSGKSLQADSRETSSGVGLRNTTDRLKAFYGDRYAFYLENTVDGGFTVKMRLPVDS